MPYNKLDLSDSRHPYRRVASRVIGEVIEFAIPEPFSKSQLIRMEDDIVAILIDLDE